MKQEKSLGRPWIIKQGQFIYDADNRLVATIHDSGWSKWPRTDEEVREIADLIIRLCNENHRPNPLSST